MKIEEVEGIVLSETNYSESSKILNVLTPKYGLLGIMSKGCRNMKSKLRGVSRKLIYGTFHIYYKENGLSTLIEVDIKTIKFVRMLYYVDIDKISKIEINDNSVQEINRFLEAYYERYTGLYLKSKKMLSKIVKKITI